MNDVSLEAVSTIVGRIYEAAYDQELWIDAMIGLRDLFGASRSCILRFNPGTAEALASEPDPELNSPNTIGVMLRDPMASRLSQLPVGIVSRFGPEEEVAFRRGELWNNLFRQRDMDHWLPCNLLSSETSQWMLSLHRGNKQDAFSAGEAELLQKILPHVLRAGEIGRRLENTSALASAFSHLPFGVFIVTGGQRLVQMNEAADAMLRRAGSPMTSSDGNISVSNSKDAEQLKSLIECACLTLDGAIPGTGGTLMVPSNHEQAALTRLVLSVAPFPGVRAYGLAPERLAVILAMEVAQRIPDGFEPHLRSLFDLTPAEARLAAALASGASLTNSALSSNIKVKTARTYLDRIL